MPNWIGDAVMATPALSALGRLFPDAEITVLAKPWVSPVVRSHPDVSALVEYKPESPLALPERIRLIMEIRKKGFDLGVLFTNSIDSAITFKASGIPMICGYSADGRGFLLDMAVPVSERKRKRHEVYYYLGLVRQLAEKVPHGAANLYDDVRPSLVICPEREAAEFADNLLRRAGEKNGGISILAGFNPGAAYGPAKCWPVEKFRILAKKIFLNMPRAMILVFGTENEKEIAARICEGHEERCLNLAGRTSLAQAVALIDRLDVLVTNDSGLMHVAAGLQTPLVALFGSTNPVTTGPWSDKSAVVRLELECSPCLERRCPDGAFECMNGITVDMVFEAVARQLSGLPDGGERNGP